MVEIIGYKRPFVSMLHTNRELQPKYCVFIQRALAPYNLSSAYTLFTVYKKVSIFLLWKQNWGK